MSRDARTPLDNEIDLVARVLTEAPPPDGVRSAIRTAVSQRSRAIHAGRWYSVGAAAAVASGILLFWISREGPPDEPSRQTITPAVATAPTQSVTEPAPSAVTTPSRTQVTVRATRGISAEVRPRSSGPLPTIPSQIGDPIQVEHLEVPPLEVDEITLPTFAVEALTLEPVSLE